MVKNDWIVRVYHWIGIPEQVVRVIIPEPTARSAVRRGLLIPLGYLHPRVNANIAKCKVIVSVMDGFRRYAHARVITDFKNMADYMKSEHWLKASEKAKTKTKTTATRL